MKINYDEIQSNVKALGNQTDNTSFLEGFLSAYNFPKATFSRLNLSSLGGVNRGVYIQNKIYFHPTTAINISSEFNILKRNDLNKINADFTIIANETDLMAYERDSGDVLKTEKIDLYRHIEFFFPLLGKKKSTVSDQIKSADMKAAEKFAQLYRVVLMENSECDSDVGELVCRLLFCCFVDSIGVLTNGGLHSFVTNYTDATGADLGGFIDHLFLAMNSKEREHLPGYFANVKFIDERLFKSKIVQLSYNREARNLILDLLGLNWSEISPEMLGGLIQSIVRPESISNGNYTSTANIHKVIGPLFMDELYRAYEEIAGNSDDCLSLLNRVSKISVLDPSCGAGNFLLVAYKELNKLANLLLDSIPDHNKPYSLPVANFHGIDSDSFSSAIARLGFLFVVCQEKHNTNESADTWITEAIDVLFLNTIVTANATRISWETVCSGVNETYIIGNPSYRGGNRKTASQKSDISHVFTGYRGFANLDYAACWFMLASKYIQANGGEFAFVTTNSLTQGEQVQLLWPKLFEKGVHIKFAYTPFKWRNDARNRNMVTVVVIGVSSRKNLSKRELFTPTVVFEPLSISPYLVPGNVIVKGKGSPISDLPEMQKGNMPYDNGTLLLNRNEMVEITSSDQRASKFVRKIIGAKEFIRGIDRWCLWIPDADCEEAMDIPKIKARIDTVRDWRFSNKEVAVKRLAEKPHQFREMREAKRTQSLIVPAVSSENYVYIPIGFVKKDTVATNLVSVIYDCEPWVFGVVASQMHNVWAKTFCGRHEERPRYSLELGYNTFPFPKITQEQKKRIYQCVLGIIGVRERYAPKTLAELYKAGQMPEDLMAAHSLLDKVIESCYRDEPFVSDRDRLGCMLELYDSMGG